MRGFTVGLAALIAAIAGAFADSYPSKPIRAIIPFGPGSATDVIPRIVFDELAARLGQPIIVRHAQTTGADFAAGTAVTQRELT